jgi:gas vesicle protein
MAFISGVTLGIAAGILCAPQSGKRTREDLQDLTSDTLDQAEEWIDTTKETVGDLLKRVLGVATAVVVAVCWLTVQNETAAYARGKRDAGAECMAIMGTMAGDTVLPSLRGTHGR